MLSKAEAGGGALLNLGFHGFDLCRYITGEEPKVVSAVTNHSIWKREVEDYAFVTSQAPNEGVAPGAHDGVSLRGTPIGKGLPLPTVGTARDDTCVRPQNLRQRLQKKSRSMDTPLLKHELATGNAD